MLAGPRCVEIEHKSRFCFSCTRDFGSRESCKVQIGDWIKVLANLREDTAYARKKERNGRIAADVMTRSMQRERNGYKKHPRTKSAYFSSSSKVVQLGRFSPVFDKRGREGGRAGSHAIANNKSNLLVSCTSDFRSKKLI